MCPEAKWETQEAQPILDDFSGQYYCKWHEIVTTIGIFSSTTPQAWRANSCFLRTAVVSARLSAMARVIYSVLETRSAIDPEESSYLESAAP